MQSSHTENRRRPIGSGGNRKKNQFGTVLALSLALALVAPDASILPGADALSSQGVVSRFDQDGTHTEAVLPDSLFTASSGGDRGARGSILGRGDLSRGRRRLVSKSTKSSKHSKGGSEADESPEPPTEQTTAKSTKSEKTPSKSTKVKSKSLKDSKSGKVSKSTKKGKSEKSMKESKSEKSKKTDPTDETVTASSSAALASGENTGPANLPFTSWFAVGLAAVALLVGSGLILFFKMRASSYRYGASKPRSPGNNDGGKYRPIDSSGRIEGTSTGETSAEYGEAGSDEDEDGTNAEYGDVI